MKFAVQINNSPYASAGGTDAFRFVQTVLQKGHEVIRVFFYKDGVYHAFAYASPPDDEVGLNRKWSDLAQRHQIDLVVCISAAQRRGLLCTEEAARKGKSDNDLAAGFRIAGLGLWVEATFYADRCIVFP